MSRFASLSVVAILLLLAACQSTTKKKAKIIGENLLVESGFEEADDPLSEWLNTQHCCDSSVTISTKHAIEGTHTLRLEVNSSDPITSGSIRSELVQDQDPVGTERWYGFNMFLEDWINDTAGEHVFQWHPANTSGTATASLWTSAGHYMLESNANGDNSPNAYDDLGPIISNEWVSWVLHVRWATDSTGLIELWKNGKKMIDKQFLPTAPPEGTYFKLGINKFGWGIQPSSTTRRVLYYDEVRIGNEKSGYEAVKPRHGAPPSTTK